MIPLTNTPGNRSELDSLPLDVLVDRFGEPVARRTYYEGSWQPGSGKPLIATDSPAEAQAIGRCLASRVSLNVVPGAIHPGPCDWCDYPPEELQRACDYAAWHSRFIVSETMSWRAAGWTYIRPGPMTGEYENPAWARFFEGTTPSTEDIEPSRRKFLNAKRAEAIARASRAEVA